MDERAHGESCNCRHHPQHRHTAPSSKAGRVTPWSSLLPALACAVCPACLATYAKVFSALGVGIALTESQHLWMLVACVTFSLLFGGWEARRTRRFAAFGLTSAGCATLVAAHLAGESRGLGWLAMALLLCGAVWGHRLRARARATGPKVDVASGTRPDSPVTRLQRVP